MGGSPCELSDELVTWKRRGKGWRMKAFSGTGYLLHVIYSEKRLFLLVSVLATVV